MVFSHTPSAVRRTSSAGRRSSIVRLPSARRGRGPAVSDVAPGAAARRSLNSRERKRFRCSGQAASGEYVLEQLLNSKTLRGRTATYYLMRDYLMRWQSHASAEHLAHCPERCPNPLGLQASPLPALRQFGWVSLRVHL